VRGCVLPTGAKRSGLPRALVSELWASSRDCTHPSGAGRRTMSLWLGRWDQIGAFHVEDRSTRARASRRIAVNHPSSPFPSRWSISDIAVELSSFRCRAIIVAARGPRATASVRRSSPSKSDSSQASPSLDPPLLPGLFTSNPNRSHCADWERAPEPPSPCPFQVGLVAGESFVGPSLLADSQGEGELWV